MSTDKHESDLVPLIDAARSLREQFAGRSIRDVSRTRLARHSTEVLSEMDADNAFLRVRVGSRAMMVVDDDFFERTRELLESVEHRLRELDPVLGELQDRFDALDRRINEAGSREATFDALFSERAPARLREQHRPGKTEDAT